MEQGVCVLLSGHSEIDFMVLKELDAPYLFCKGCVTSNIHKPRIHKMRQTLHRDFVGRNIRWVRCEMSNKVELGGVHPEI